MNWHSPELVSKLEARCGVEDLMFSNSKVRCTRSEGEQLLLYWGNGQYMYLTLQWNHSHELALTWTGDETWSKMWCGRSEVFEQQAAVQKFWCVEQLFCIEAMCSAFRSAESEAIHSAEHYGPLKTRLYHRAKHYGLLKARLKTTAKSQIFVPFFYI